MTTEIYSQTPTAGYHMWWWKIKDFTLGSRRKDWYKILSLYFTRGLARIFRQESKIEVTQIWKKETKWSLITDDIILYTENTWTRQFKSLLELINMFNKFVWYKWIYKIHLYFYMLWSENKIKKTIYLTIYQNNKMVINLKRYTRRVY